MIILVAETDIGINRIITVPAVAIVKSVGVEAVVHKRRQRPVADMDHGRVQGVFATQDGPPKIVLHR